MLECVARIGVRDRFCTGPVRVIATAAAVLAVLTTIVGVGWNNGYPAEKVRLLSGAAWLPSSHAGQLTLLDGSSAEVAAQVQVAPPGDRLGSVQHGTTAYAINHTTGSIRRIDGGTFDVASPVTPIPGAGEGLQVYASADAVYVLDTQRGLLTQTDPATLAGRSESLPLAGQVSAQAATLDDAGRLWILDTATGDLTWIEDGQRDTRRRASQPGSGRLVLAGRTPVLIDGQGRTAATLDPDTGDTHHTTRLDLRPDDTIQVGGSSHAPRLYVVTSRGVLAVCDLTSTSCGDVVPLGEAGLQLGPPIETGDRVFVPDYTTGRVWIVDLKEKRVIAQPQVLAPPVRFQLLARDGIVFFNDPDSERAGVLRADGSVVHVPKYDPKPSVETSRGQISSALPDRKLAGDVHPSPLVDSSATAPPAPDQDNPPPANSSSGPEPEGDPAAGGDPATEGDPSTGGDAAAGGNPFDFELFDDFGDSAINPERWVRGEGFDSVPPLIYAQDGRLHMQVTKENGAGENSAILRADLARPARAISFEMTLLSSDGVNKGGGYAVVSSQDDRNHKLIMGPDGNGSPAAGYYICDNESGCDDGVYEDFEHPGESRLQPKKRYNVLIYQSDAGWSFRIDGFPEVVAKLEDGPIRNFEFSVYSFGAGVFHVTVDNVKIDYATY